MQTSNISRPFYKICLHVCTNQIFIMNKEYLLYLQPFGGLMDVAGAKIIIHYIRNGTVLVQ